MILKLSKILFLLFVFSLSTSVFTLVVDFSLSAIRLPILGFLLPDPYVEVTLFEGNSTTGMKIGQTDIIGNTRNPTWPNVFSFNYINGTFGRLRFDLWDQDFGSDDFMGYVEVPIVNVVSPQWANRSVLVPFFGAAIPGVLNIQLR